MTKLLPGFKEMYIRKSFLKWYNRILLSVGSILHGIYMYNDLFDWLLYICVIQTQTVI